MEANKEEAAKALELGKRALAKRDLERAAKFISKVRDIPKQRVQQTATTTKRTWFERDVFAKLLWRRRKEEKEKEVFCFALPAASARTVLLTALTVNS